MKARKLVAHNLRRLRVARGISQEALAVDAAIDRTYVSRLERDMENPSVDVLERLSIALRVGIVEFFSPVKAGVARPAPLRSGRKPRS
jgi:transcriptional regulator with XRE-family HTH domain